MKKIMLDVDYFSDDTAPLSMEIEYDDELKNRINRVKKIIEKYDLNEARFTYPYNITFYNSEQELMDDDIEAGYSDSRDDYIYNFDRDPDIIEVVVDKRTAYINVITDNYSFESTFLPK